jgi:hypothetical protein
MIRDAEGKIVRNPAWYSHMVSSWPESFSIDHTPGHVFRFGLSDTPKEKDDKLLRNAIRAAMGIGKEQGMKEGIQIGKRIKKGEEEFIDAEEEFTDAEEEFTDAEEEFSDLSMEDDNGSESAIKETNKRRK